MRKGCQTFALLLIIIIPLVSFYSVLLNVTPVDKHGQIMRHTDEGSYNQHQEAMRPLIKKGIQWIDTYIFSYADDPHQTVKSLEEWKGTYGSLTLAGITFSDPLQVAANLLSGRAIVLTFIVSGVAIILFTMIFGRIFCSWICPMSLLSDLNMGLRRILMKIGIPLSDFPIDKKIKYWVLGFGLIFSLFGLNVIPYLLPYSLIGRAAFQLVYYSSIGIGFIIIMLILLFDLFVSERAWCRSLCPAGAWISWVGKKRMVRIVQKGNGCKESCNQCNLSCPYDIEPKKGNITSECSSCAICISVCPTNNFSFVLKSPLKQIKKNRSDDGSLKRLA
ncbi:4Fe-4S binding protein [Microaerobacter geothermalis]|nr:4Fe-4S binding protein [Microaerobacter geothermalis]